MADSTWKEPTRRAAAVFRLRVLAHVIWRGLRNRWSPTFCHAASDKLKDAPVVAQRRSKLWQDGRADEFSLVAGKVHNLRLARAAFDGLFVPAGSALSFWRQLGRPSRWRGFVEGREVREGCVVPTIAGGLCQLSNALAACAADCGMTLTERHGHTARVARSTPDDPSGGIDATVFWNYVDLRFVAPFDFRIEVDLTADELVVRLRAIDARRQASVDPPSLVPIAPAVAVAPPVARGCVTCDQRGCFRHRPQAGRPSSGSTAVLVNAWTPEFARYLSSVASDADWFVPWIRPARRRGGTWAPQKPRLRKVAVVASLCRTLLLLRHAGEGGGRQGATLQADRWLADAYLRCLEPRHTHLVVDQSLLVPLRQAGALAGRTYDVLVHALPADELQRRLDAAAARWPEATSLTDFRVVEAHCQMEGDALRGARRLVTPHAEVARHLRARIAGAHVDRLDWLVPPASPRRHLGVPRRSPVVAFPASALARKGAHEMAEAVRHLGWRLIVLGTPSSDPRIWSGIDVAHVPYVDPVWLTCADVAALPAHIEHSPRALLRAIANGIPVVASTACGLPPSLGATEVPAGDTQALIAALQLAIRSTSEADYPLHRRHGARDDGMKEPPCNP